jgi:hypothetical protein
MPQAVAMPESSQLTIRAPQVDAFARLTRFGWSGGLIFITALLAASFFWQVIL